MAMLKKSLWFLARMSIVLINAIGLSMYVGERTNFGVLAGAICGIIALAVLFPWIRRQANSNERLNTLGSPFWPMHRYPLAWWFTIGVALLSAAIVNIPLNVGDRQATEFLSGFLMIGAGITLAAVLAKYLPEKRRVSESEHE